MFDFLKKIRREHLLDGSIYSDERGTLATRQAYAWRVYNSTTETKYTSDHKKAALLFLTTTFRIETHDVAEDVIVQKITAQMQPHIDHFDTLSMTSLDDSTSLASFGSDDDPTTPPSLISDILRRMPSDKLSTLLDIMLHGKQFSERNLRHLYPKKEEPGYKEYQLFLKQHSISFFGGTNTLNFKITSRRDHTSCILKIENRLEPHKDAAPHLRDNSLGDILSPVTEERQATSIDKKGLAITRYIVITSLCQGEPLSVHATHYHHNDRFDSAFPIYIQMASILHGIQNDGCAFLDMANSHWLIDEQNKVRIADSASFVFANAAGDLEDALPDSTQRANPDFPLSVEKIHLYLLGKNLYQYLTGCPSTYLDTRRNTSSFDFSATLFQTEQGKLLQDLIKSMLNAAHPTEQLTMDSAIDQLKQIKTFPLRNACQTLLRKIKPTGSEEDDIALNNFFRDKQKQMAQIDNDDKLLELKAELNTILSQFNTNSTMRDIKNKIRDINTNLAKTIGMQTKLNKITAELNQLPISERKNNSEAETRLLSAVLSLYTDSQRHKDCLAFLQTTQDSTSKKHQDYFNKKISEIYNAENLADLDTFKQQVIFDLTTFKCHHTINEIRRYRFGEVDEAMNSFIKQQNKMISTAKTLDNIHAVLDNLQTILMKTKESAILTQIRGVISKFRNNAFFYTIGMHAKANRIEQAMTNVPVEERCNIMKGQIPETVNVQKALASHRHFWKKGQEINQDGSINEQRAATSFQMIKTRFSH